MSYPDISGSAKGSERESRRGRLPTEQLPWLEQRSPRLGRLQAEAQGQAQTRPPRPPGYLPTNSCGSRFSTSGLSCTKETENKEVSLALLTQSYFLQRPLRILKEGKKVKAPQGTLRVSQCFGDFTAGTPEPFFFLHQSSWDDPVARFSLSFTASSRDRHSSRLRRANASHPSPAHVAPARYSALAGHPRMSLPQLVLRKQEVATLQHEVPRPKHKRLPTPKSYFILLV